MKKLASLVLIATSGLNACQPATTAATATLTFPATGTVISTETATPLPTNEPTPTLELIQGGWSTFHAPEYGFQFQYPAVYDKGFYDAVDSQVFCNIESKKEDGKFNVWVGFVWIIVEETDQSLASIFDAYVKEKSIHWDIRSQIDVKIGGLPAVRVEYDRETPSRQGFKTFLIHNNDLLTIEYYEAPFSSCGPNDTGYSSYWVYEQVVNTLRFDP